MDMFNKRQKKTLTYQDGNSMHHPLSITWLVKTQMPSKLISQETDKVLT